MNKSGRQLFQPEAPLFWAFNILLQMSEKEIRERFDLTAGQLKLLKLGNVPDSVAGKRMRRFLSHRIDKFQGIRCREKFIREYRSSFIRCLQGTLGFTVPRRKRTVWSEDKRHNRVEDAREYLVQFFKEWGPRTKKEVKMFTKEAGFDWRMIRKAADELGVDLKKVRWRLP